MDLMEVRGVNPNVCSGHDLCRKLPPFPTHTIFFQDVLGYLAFLSRFATGKKIQ